MKLVPQASGSRQSLPLHTVQRMKLWLSEGASPGTAWTGKEDSALTAIRQSYQKLAPVLWNRSTRLTSPHHRHKGQNLAAQLSSTSPSTPAPGPIPQAIELPPQHQLPDHHHPADHHPKPPPRCPTTSALPSPSSSSLVRRAIVPENWTSATQSKDLNSLGKKSCRRLIAPNTD